MSIHVKPATQRRFPVRMALAALSGITGALCIGLFLYNLPPTPVYAQWAATATGGGIPSPARGQPGDSKPKTVLDMLKSIAEAEPLTEAQATRAKELIANLGAQAYDAREGATLELLLLPRGVGVLLYEHRLHADLEVRGRVQYLLDEIQRGAAIESYIARLAGHDRGTVTATLQKGGEDFDKLLGRMVPARLTDDTRVWSALMLGADTPERRQKVLDLYAARKPDQPVLDLYLALRTHHESRSQARRAHVLDLLPSDAASASVLALLEASAPDPASEVRRARGRMLTRARETSSADSLLALFNESKEPGRKSLLLELVRLGSATQEVRAQWLTAGRAETDAGVSQAFLAMACREGLHEVLEERIASGAGGKELLSLLAIIGTPGYWQRVLDHAKDDSARTEALTWLPFSTIDPAMQLDLLLKTQAATQGQPRSQAAIFGLLASYGNARAVNALLTLAAGPGGAPAGAALAQHARLLPAVVSNPVDQPWFKAMEPRLQAAVLMAYPPEISAQPLAALSVHHDTATASLAMNTLARHNNTFTSRILLVAAAQGRLMAIDPRVRADLARITPEQAFEIVRRDNAAAEQPPVDPASAPPRLNRGLAEPLPYALAIHGHEPLRAALNDGTLARSDRLLLLGLFPDAVGGDALVSAAERVPASIMEAGTLLLALGHHAAVVRAYEAAGQARNLSQVVPGIMAEILMNDANARVRLREFVELLARQQNDDALIQALAACAFLDDDVNRLDTLEGIAMNRSTSRFRQMLLLAAAPCKGLTQEWVDRIKGKWTGETGQEVGAALLLLDAIVASNTDAIAVMASEATDIVRNCALFAHARAGNRISLVTLMDTAVYTGPGTPEFAMPLGPPDGWLCVPALALLDGVPAGLDWAQRRQFWNSTRLTWKFDPQRGMYVQDN